MSGDSRKFPFQDLPAVAKEHVVQVMDGQERLTFSVLSNNANRMSKPLCQQAEKVIIDFGSGIKLKTDNEQFPTVTVTLNHDFTPGTVHSTCEYIDGEKQSKPSEKILNRPEYSARDWIDHFKGLVKCQEVELHFRLGSAQWEVSAILKMVNGLKIKEIELFENVGENGVTIVEHCTDVKQVFFTDHFPEDDARNTMLRREFDYFGVLGLHRTRLSLDEILLTRNKVMDFMSTHLNKTTVNTLLLKWVDGWNSNFEAMNLRYVPGAFEDIPDILNGIHYRFVDDIKDRSMFKGGENFWSIASWNQEAYQIQRRGTGVKARLSFGHIDAIFIVKLIVQH